MKINTAGKFWIGYFAAFIAAVLGAVIGWFEDN